MLLAARRIFTPEPVRMAMLMTLMLACCGLLGTIDDFLIS